jgi:hypothetical protein
LPEQPARDVASKNARAEAPKMSLFILFSMNYGAKIGKSLEFRG